MATRQRKKKIRAKKLTAKQSSSDIVRVITRQQLVRKLLIQGHGPVWIAKTLGVPQPTIKKDIRLIYESFQERSAIEWGKHVAEQLARIELIEQTAWEAWERSLKKKKTVEKKTEESEYEDNSKIIKILERKTKYEDQHGNPQFMKILIECVTQRSKLLGLDRKDDEEVGYDDTPIVSVVINNNDDKQRMIHAEEFLQINGVVMPKPLDQKPPDSNDSNPETAG